MARLNLGRPERVGVGWVALLMSVGLCACAQSTTSDDTTGSGTDSGSRDATVDVSGGDATILPLGDGAARDARPSIDATVDSSGGDATAAVDAGAGDAVQGDSAGSDSGGLPEAGGDAGSCGSTPTLHPGSGTNLFCPFGPDAGAPLECTSGQQYCCISGKVGGSYPPSDCEAISPSGCTAVKNGVAGSTQIACEDPATDCPSGQVCCGSPNAIALASGCTYDKLVGFTYSKCAASCAVSEFQICEATSQCGSGKTCTPFKAKGLQLGYCK